MKRAIILCLLLEGVSSPAFSAWMEERTIKAIGMESDFAVIWLTTPYSSNPNGCTVQPLDSAILPKSNPSFSEIYSALLAASLAGKRVNYWSLGCVSAWGSTHPRIDNIKVFP